MFEISFDIKACFRWLIDRTAESLVCFAFSFFFFSRSSGLNERIFVEFLFVVQPLFFSQFVSSAIFDVFRCACAWSLLFLSFSLVFFFWMLLSFFSSLFVGRARQTVASSFFLCLFVACNKIDRDHYNLELKQNSFF